MPVLVEDLVPAIRAMWQAEMRRTSPFHLAACQACGAPSWQYPCPNCAAYPDASEPKSASDARRAAAMKSGVGSRDAFIARVDRAGGIGAFYFAEFRRTVAYQDARYTFRPKIDELIERAKAVAWPDAGEVWDIVSGENRPLNGDSDADRQAWQTAAVARYGEEEARRLRSVQEGRTWHSWPDNCLAGAEILRNDGVEKLLSLGIPEAAPAQAPLSQAAPRF